MATAGQPETETGTTDTGAAPIVPLAGCRVSMFENAFGQEPKDVALAKVLEAIRTGRWRKQVEALRALLPANPDVYDDRKRLLPGFCMSGTGADRHQPRAHSGLLQVDLDHLNGDLPTVRERVKADPHVAFGYVSPSGVGLKLGVRIDPERHEESFAAAQAYFEEQYGAKIDPKVRDRLRLCFVSYDPEVWVNAHAVPLPLGLKSSPITTAPAADPEPNTEGAGRERRWWRTTNGSGPSGWSSRTPSCGWLCGG
jgi:hypothetical protein